MSRLTLTALLLLCAATAQAWTKLPGAMSHMRVHYRMAVDTGTEAKFRIALGDTSQFCEISAKAESETDDFFERFLVRLSANLSRISENNDTAFVFPVYKYTTKNAGLSFRLTQTHPGILLLEVGQSLALFSKIIKTDAKPLFIDFSSNSKKPLLRANVDYEAVEGIHPSRFTTIDGLNEAIAASSNPIVGIWEHYDQSCPSLRVSSATRYRLAIVPAPQDGFEIIYLDSEGKINPLWQPLSLKGRLTDTGFDNIYNLEWLDMDGAPADRDATAQFEAPKLLTLRFPYWDTTIRFVKK